MTTSTEKQRACVYKTALWIEYIFSHQARADPNSWNSASTGRAVNIPHIHHHLATDACAGIKVDQFVHPGYSSSLGCNSRPLNLQILCGAANSARFRRRYSWPKLNLFTSYVILGRRLSARILIIMNCGYRTWLGSTNGKVEGNLKQVRSAPHPQSTPGLKDDHE